MPLLLKGTKPASVFGLVGTDENSATYAMGWTLDACPTFRRLFVQRIFNLSAPLQDHSDVLVELQRHATDDGGFTDLELRSGTHYHAVIEAKCGWQVPSSTQFTRYHSRFKSTDARRKRLVSISTMQRDQAYRLLPRTIEGVEVFHLSWGDLQALAKHARAISHGKLEKQWLQQWIQHLMGYIAVERLTDNRVYVVSLNGDRMRPGAPKTYIDVVETDKCYFHAIAPRWPRQPVTYMGFRYDGRLQSINFVESFQVVANLARVNPSWITTDSDHFAYQLGPSMRPPREMRTGNIYRSGRVTCALDMLLSGQYNTISEARDTTALRLGDAIIEM